MANSLALPSIGCARFDPGIFKLVVRHEQGWLSSGRVLPLERPGSGVEGVKEAILVPDEDGIADDDRRS